MTDDQSQGRPTESENQVIDLAQKQNPDMNVKVLTDISPQNTSDKPCSCGNSSDTMPVTSNSHIYTIGRIKPRFPSPSVEKEFVQATGRTETKGLTDPEALNSVLSQKQNRYLVRQLCWVLTIEGVEIYILVPRDLSDYDLLIEALRPTPRVTDVDVIIGVRGPMADPRMCNGLMVPVVMFDQIYSFDVDSLIKSVPRPQNIPAKQFNAAAEDLFGRIMLMADNAGATDEHRALNYLSVRYQAIYSHTAEMFGRDFSLSAIEVRPSPLSGVRKIVDVVFVYINRNTDVADKYFTRVDVTEEFPFLITKLSPYYDL
jgi:PatG Domain